MAQNDNTLLYIALAAAAYFLFVRKPADAQPVPAAAAVVEPSPKTVIYYGHDAITPGYGKGLPYYYSVGKQIQLAYGQAPPSAPYGYVWVAEPTGAQPAEGAMVIWTLRATQKARWLGPPIPATA